LRALAARLTQVREEERTEIAREIHDVLGQALTGLKMDLSWLGKRASAVPEDELAGVLQDKIQEMCGVVDSTIATVRKIATQLRPALLDDLGLEAAAEWQVQEFQNRSGIACRFVSKLNDAPVAPASATALFRILQETLTNVARHAQASRVEIRLQLKGPNVQLTVRDNGRGVTPREISNTKSLGLLGIRERTLLVGGEIQITGAERKGTTVIVQVPLHGKPPAIVDAAGIL
ncbi:MAG TPA: sensor histidine kinase, partial [Abditibacteriaceae bacterium]|jgi:signal transduction histidine kinase